MGPTVYTKTYIFTCFYYQYWCSLLWSSRNSTSIRTFRSTCRVVDPFLTATARRPKRAIGPLCMSDLRGWHAPSIASVHTRRNLRNGDFLQGFLSVFIRYIYLDLSLQYIYISRLPFPSLPFPFFSMPFIFLALLSRSLPVVTQIRGRIAGAPPLLSTTVRALAGVFIAGRIQHFFSPRRLAPNFAKSRAGAFCHFFLFTRKNPSWLDSKSRPCR